MMITFQQSLKRIGQNWLMFFLLFLIASSVNAQISGTVFRDFNANGVKNNTATYNEPGLEGITVKAYNSSNALVATTTSAANGSYSFTGLTLPLRIEFTGFSTADYTGVVGTNNASSVQFYSAASSSANFGVNYPQHYTSTSNPYYIVSQFAANRPPSSDPLATAMLKQQYSVRGSSNYAPSIANASQIGATWAVAYDRKNSLIYSAAFAKRHSAMKDNDGDGKEDLGAIYSMTENGSPALWQDLSTLGIDFGTSLLPTITARGLPTTLTGPSHDAAMFALVGKIGIGGITLSDDFTKMYVMNLYDKKIYTIDIASKTLLSSSSVVPSSCTSGNSRPFALKYHRGKVYVGSICDATTSGDFNNLTASVFSYDGTTFTSVLTYPLNYTKGYTFKDLDNNTPNGIQDEWGKQWNAWSDVMPSSIFTSNLTSPPSQVILNPQPMLVNLEFDYDESLIMVFIDRFGHQAGQVNYGTNTSNTSNFYTALSAGDILRASYSSGIYSIENAGVVGGLTGNTTNVNGPGGGEFYHGDHDINNYHAENVIGGSTFFPGKNEVATIVTDPINYFAGGVFYFDNINGDVVNGTDNYQLYPTTLDNTKFGKANGLGDIEIITDAAPIEIGNRVWLDTNGDGIQDAGEAAISGVTVQLLNSVGTVIATATTDANGNYYFSSASGTSTAALIYGVAILPNTNYTVRIPNVQGGSKQAVLGGNFLTTSNADNTDGDIRDSDGILNANNADVAITTGGYGENNHTYDFGFTSTLLCTKPNAGANQTSCPTGTITLTGTTPTTGTWTAQTGNPSGASVGSTTSGIATVTFTAATAGTFNFIYTTGSCTDTMSVVVSGSIPSTPTCSPVSVCTGADATSAVTAAVSPAGGTITWNTGSATTATSYTYTVTSSCGSANCSNTITRTSSPSTPTCSPVSVCTGADATATVTAAVSPAGGTITWNTG
ncbi:MAG: SdrD B-like domain-containing protein, partial [Dolichospermum sp.]